MSCLDHIYLNQPQRIRIRNVICHNIGLADHLPVFAVRKYHMTILIVILVEHEQASDIEI